MQAKNIIFDFGNVLLNIDMSRIRTGFEKVLGAETERLSENLQKRSVFTLYETGGLSTDEFLEQICYADASGRLSPESVKKIWNSIFIGMQKERFDMLLKLRTSYRVFLLSNINDLHLNWIQEYMRETHEIHDFERRFFDGVYYSHFVRMRKPNQDIYSFMLDDADMKPEESIFLTTCLRI